MRDISMSITNTKLLIEQAGLFRNKNQSKDCGVLFVTDNNTFAGAYMCALTCNYPVSIVDIGMDSSQKALCNDSDINIITYNDVKPDTYYWQTWIKPFCLKLSPYKYTLYLDTDTLCMKNLDYIFEYIKDLGVFVVKDEAGYSNVNAGVIGYSYDTVLVDIFKEICSECFDNNLYSKYKYYDECCLNECVARLNIKPSDDYTFNRLSPIIPCLTESNILIGYNEAREHLKYNYLYSYTTCRKFLGNKNINDKNTILHYRGRKKPWTCWIT